MAGYEVVTCIDETHRFLDDFPYERNNGGAIFIHKSILLKFNEKISSTGWQTTDRNTWPYSFRIGNENYEMYLVWINMDAMIMSKLHLIVSESKYSFPWQPNMTFYTTENSFYLVDQFIEKCKLKQFVLNRYSDTTRLCLPHNIRVVEFKNSIPRDILPQFRTYLELNEYKLPFSYFVARAFKFLRPDFLKLYKPCYEYNPDTLTQIVLLLDYHRAQAKRNIEIFNLFDLIAMKMAIDDNRFDYINCEFDKLIHRKLNELSANRVYIKSKRFNLVDYCNDLEVPGYSEELYQYLITQYHGYFSRVVIHEYGILKVPLQQIKNIGNLMTGYLKRLEINVSNLTNCNTNILMDILSYPNLGFQPIITFDTSKEIDCTMQNSSCHNTLVLPSRNLKFIGTNTSCFIENFFNWIKQTFGTQYPNFDIKFVATKINCPYIFRGLTVRMIVIKKMDITCQLLRALKYVKFEIIKISQCFVECNPDIFVLLENLSGDRYVQINSDSSTFGILMDAIRMQLIKSGLEEFRFESYITVYYLESEFDFIDLSRYKFSFNGERSKVLAYDLYTDEMVDIFNYFYRPQIEDLGDSSL